MFHSQQVIPGWRRVKARARGFFGCVATLAALGGCDGEALVVPSTLFGENGRIQVEVRSLLPGDARNGTLDEVLVWASNGGWLLAERVSYVGNLGAETVQTSRLNPGELVTEYASLIQQLNEAQGLRLFSGEVPQSLEPVCEDPLPTTRVVFTIRDETRDEVARWIRCAEGTLFTFEPGSAAPDAGASRVITAGQLTRFFTVGEESISTYGGTIPFGTLDQGTDSSAREASPRAFVSDDDQPPAEFVDFWARHAGAGVAPPEVEWGSEMVLLVAVGLRREVGDLVGIRRVLPLGPANGTRVEVIERVPGDFCSPAGIDHYPYQLAVVPTEDIHPPVEFTAPEVRRIPCGA